MDIYIQNMETLTVTDKIIVLHIDPTIIHMRLYKRHFLEAYYFNILNNKFQCILYSCYTDNELFLKIYPTIRILPETQFQINTIFLTPEYSSDENAFRITNVTSKQFIQFRYNKKLSLL
jgi:hypothetical protein